MKLHPLHTHEQIAIHVINTKEYFPSERATGRTEQQALKWVAQAMHTPHKWHRVCDHHATRPTNMELVRRCRRIVENMGYQYFHFRDVEICFGEPPCRE